MAGKQILFFADVADMQSIIEEMEAAGSNHYFLAGLFDDETPKKYDSLLETPGWGYVANGDWNHNPSYIILPRSEDVKLRVVPQKKGGIKYAVDQLQNPISCVIRPCGIFADNILVGGLMGSISSSDFSTTLIKAFGSLVKAKFKVIGQFYVGDGAKAKLHGGWRLVTNSRSPLAYDLKE